MKALKTLIVFGLIVFINCFSHSSVFAQTPVEPISAEKKSPDVQKTAIVKTSENQDSVKRDDEKYRIGYLDTLEIMVAKHQELSQTVNVSPDGTIVLPRIDEPVTVVCKTERELKDELEKLYTSYLKKPYVNVRVTEQRSQPVSVVGAVQKPGSFNLYRRVRLLELLAFAGGPDVENVGTKVQIARVGNENGCSDPLQSSDETKFLSYKLTDVQKGTENPYVQPGDVVSVLTADQAYVVGNVKEPTKFSLKEPVTLMQAIVIGGGLLPAAKTDKVLIQRQEPNSSVKTELAFNLKDIRDKKIPDPVLQANDIVEVPKDSTKAVRNGLISVITRGLPNVFYSVGLP